MFFIGLINSLFSFITFQNKELRKVGCGIHLLMSSITSLITISIVTVKFFFVLFTHIDIKYVHPSIISGGCISIEPLVKLFVFLDGWLNACVAIERTIQVFHGTSFNKEKSTRVARWVILLLPFGIMGTIIHEPIYRRIFRTKGFKPFITTDKHEKKFWCLTRYSPVIQTYNTIILFFHLVAPCIINLFSALFIIIQVTRQRSIVQQKLTYKEHFRQQLYENKHLLISSITLLLLALPRLIISMLSTCTEATQNPWLYLSSYFIAFIPSILIFTIFVVPSTLYMKTFKQSINTYRRYICRQ
ncbi:unnamed protein product [Adineta ricciae]|uniref:G-protein coupled receptors family 1 profile domain-containing protein n=1 Tax=Adineta ricciae TaxID=249248 RepID=A0A815TEG2_ADIRI|nr:unnamed protein product [Adineta ricciae]CAF1674768.1 unnamed protein product [Adineta ricciae]